MRVLTLDQSAAWLSERGLRLVPAEEWGFDHQVELPSAYRRIWFGTPKQPAGQLSLAHLLASWFQCSSSALFINVVTLFEPHEVDALLFLRRCYGETRWIDGVPGGATPGHLFDDDLQVDQRNVREFVSVMLAYTFGGYLVQADGDVIIWLADEVVDIYARTGAQLATPEEIISTLGLEIYGRQ